MTPAQGLIRSFVCNSYRCGRHELLQRHSLGHTVLSLSSEVSYPHIIMCSGTNAFNRKSGIMDNGNDLCPLFTRPNSLANTQFSSSPWFPFSLEIICGGACCKFVGFFIPHTRGQQNQSDRACHEPILISKDRHRDILYLDLFKT